MIIINTLTFLAQLALGIFVSLICMNILLKFNNFTKMATFTAPSLFVNHGGGPMPVMGDEKSKDLTIFLRDEIHKIVDFKKIKAIILVTAHWEESVVTISSSDHHDLYFDYYNFPPETYKYKYEAPGEPNLAKRIHEALSKEGIPAKLDSKRGWDHGVFVPMMLINPSANIPIVQVSVLENQDPAKHFKYGEILGQFRKEGVAIIGSGMSYHNMREFFNSRSDTVVNESFDKYLEFVCLSDREKRREGVEMWREQPGASESHPPRAAEHLMPLFVIAGAGLDGKGERVFKSDYSNKFRLGAYLWKNIQ